MNLSHYRDALRQYGLRRTLYEAAYHAANKVTDLTIWNAVVVTMETVDRRFLKDPKRAHGRFYEAQELKLLARTPGSDLDPAFIDAAMAQGDRCFAFVEHGVLAAYGWYARRPTEAAPGLVLHFDPSRVYMYKGFTHPDFRGQRLHAIGMASALDAYTREGAAGVVSIIDSANFASIKSCERMGYRTFGRILIWKRGGTVVTRASPGCARYGFRVEAVSAGRPAGTLRAAA